MIKAEVLTAVNKTRRDILLQLFLLLLTFFIVFLKIGNFQVRWWDESFFAVNTYEMMHNGHYFSRYFDQVPDLVNNKPPLSSWAQAITVKLFGYNEVGIRLPSAIAATLTILVLFRFLLYRWGAFMALTASLVLLTSKGFVWFHTARTADSDALLTLFLTLAILRMLNFLENGNKKHILYFFLFISLAFATKSVAAFFFLPGVLTVLLLQKKLAAVLSIWQFYAGLVFLLCSALLLLYLRERESPGYLHALLGTDAGRILSTVDGHNEPFLFYFDNLMTWRFSWWMVPACAGAVLAFVDKEKKNREFFRSILLPCALFLCIISASVTKLEWYDMPLYPWLAIAAAYPIYLLARSLNSARTKLILLFLIVAYPYSLAFRQSQSNTMSPGEKKNEACERFLNIHSKGNDDLDGITVYFSGPKSSLLFYKYKLADMGQRIELVQFPGFKMGDRVLVSNDSLVEVLKAKYDLEETDHYEDAKLFRVKKEK
jgi:4-amino-4-deoxy-L-arabinose transferase-like glycosyltransferase